MSLAPNLFQPWDGLLSCIWINTWRCLQVTWDLPVSFYISWCACTQCIPDFAWTCSQRLWEDSLGMSSLVEFSDDDATGSLFLWVITDERRGRFFSGHRSHNAFRSCIPFLRLYCGIPRMARSVPPHEGESSITLINIDMLFKWNMVMGHMMKRAGHSNNF